MTRLIALLFFPISTAMAVPAAEPWNSVIQDAQKLAMGKSRKQATAKILTALKTDKWTAKGRAKLIESLKSLSEVFFTDQGQRLFETGQSLAFETPDTAMARFRESLVREDGNTAVLLAMARVQLAKKDCTGADQTLRSAGEMNPYDSTLRFLQAKALLCQHKAQEALALLKSEGTPLDDVVGSTTLASAIFEAGATDDAAGLLEKAAAKDGSFPEVHYWIWKIAEDKDDTQGERYVALCKNLNVKTRRKYLNEPRLCGQTQEVEDALKAEKSSDS